MPSSLHHQLTVGQLIEEEDVKVPTPRFIQHALQTEGRVKHKVRLGVELKGIHTHIPSDIW